MIDLCVWFVGAMLVMVLFFVCEYVYIERKLNGH